MELPSLSQPARLLWLVLLLPLLYWLAQPPRPRRVHWTAHRAQWLLAQAALRRRPPRFRALRWLLLSAAAVAVSLAHAGPTGAAAAGPQRLVVLLDGSASMGATGSGNAGTPFARAVAVLRRELAAVPPHVQVEVLRLAAGGLQRWSGAAARALADAGEPAGELPAPLATLAAAAAAEPGTAVWTLTDGQDGDLPAEGALTCTGARAGNAALLDVQWTDHWPLPELELLVTARSFAAAPAHGLLYVTGPVAAEPPVAVDLPMDRAVTVPLALRRQAEGGRLLLRLAVDGDALASDDRFELELPALPAPRIAVLADGDGGPYVRAAGKALAAEVGGSVVDAAAGEPAGYLLVEGGRAALAPGQSALLAFGVAPPAREPEVWPEPALTDWDRADPLLAGLDWSELLVAHALRHSLPPGRPLLWGSVPGGADEPLAVLVEGPAAASLHFAFRLQDSNLALLPAFPQLLRRAFLAGHERAARARVRSAPVHAHEADLRRCGGAAGRPLPAFGAPGEDLAPTCLFLALALLAARAFLR